MSPLKESALGDIAGLRQRNPAAMRGDWRARSLFLLGLGIALAAFIAGFGTLNFSWGRLFSGFGELGRILGLMLPPEVGTTSRLLLWTHALGETLAIAFLGTGAAALLAFPFGFLAARNVVPAWLVRFLTRRIFDGFRGVDTLIWALIWINVVGLGPFAGALAIMTSDFGAFGKLFSEAIEAADRREEEGVISTGGNRLHGIRFGLIPQVLPVLLSQVLYYFESNTRSATIIGIVGAGGIGLHLSEQIRTLEWQHVSFLIVMILATVAVIDFISARIRFAVIGRKTRS